MKTTEITNSENVIDSRDIIARIEELRGDLDALLSAVMDAESGESREKALSDLAVWLDCDVDDFPDSFAAIHGDFPLKDYRNSDEAVELYALEDLAEQAEGCADWHHGETLIRDSYFEDYARELAEDIGTINKDAAWPACHIDWTAAADALKQDYTEVDFDGTTYYLRS